MKRQIISCSKTNITSRAQDFYFKTERWQLAGKAPGRIIHYKNLLRNTSLSSQAA